MILKYLKNRKKKTFIAIIVHMLFHLKLEENETGKKKRFFRFLNMAILRK